MESLIGRPLAGADFRSFLATQRDRDLFDTHLQTVVQQAEHDMVAEIQERRKAKCTPMWEEWRWHRRSITMAPVFNYDLHCAITANQKSIPASIFLSSGFGIPCKMDQSPNMIIAIRINHD